MVHIDEGTGGNNNNDDDADGGDGDDNWGSGDDNNYIQPILLSLYPTTIYLGSTYSEIAVLARRSTHQTPSRYPILIPHYY